MRYWISISCRRMLWDHVRYTVRMLAKNPGFTLAAITCLALGIGATTGIFSVVHGVLLKPLPYNAPGQLVRIYTEFPKFPNGGLLRFAASSSELFYLRQESTAWRAIEAWQIGAATLSSQSEAVRVTEAYVTGGMLPMLGVPPLLGRTFSEQEDKPGAPFTAVLSYGLWKRAYGGDPGILGRDIRHDGSPCPVIGVMPEGFAFPPGEADEPELWVPLQLNPAARDYASHRLQLVGRLAGGVSLEQARAEMTRLVYSSGQRTAPNTHGFNPAEHPIRIARFKDEVVRNVRLAMLVLLGAVAFLLLISTLNVANLLVARAETRKREIAIRQAIGASTGSLVRQFVVEGLLLSSLGAALGLALAYGGMRLIVRMNAGSLPRAHEIALDTPVLLFTIVVSLLTGVTFGMMPLMHVWGQRLDETLKAAAGRITTTAGAHYFRTVLVAAEIALALILLIGAGLLVKAFWKLQAVPTGLNPSNVATVRVTLPRTVYSKPEARAAFWREIENRVSAIPGVQSAAVATFIPPSEYFLGNDTQIEGFVPRPGGPLESVDHYNAIGAKYFETLGIPLLEGRAFESRDGASSPEVVIVNQTMARTFWPGESALGKRLRPIHRGNWRTVAGVVADVKNSGLDRPAGTELYFPEPQASAYGGDSTMTVLVRGAPGRNVMLLSRPIRANIQAVDPAAAMSSTRSMSDVLDSARSRPRFLAMLLTLFSALSIALAALGIYGVMSYSVAQRTSEIGIRMAIGARSEDVLRLVLRNGLMVTIAGTAAGALGAFALTRVMRGLLFGVPAVDPATFAAMALLLAGVTLFACYVPARRAARIDPLRALRYE